MTIKTETKTINITLKLWRGGWNAGYEPDCFDDLENGSFAREDFAIFAAVGGVNFVLPRTVPPSPDTQKPPAR